ncbi:MAG: class I SAM-dependent methyltransferase [Herpetosiphonaceae bacterium]|nr:class I SAM-dependent methyltransferase [Herpetosiphonaceae bacterium]
MSTLKAAAAEEDRPWRILDVGGYFPPRDGMLPLPSFLPDNDTLVVDTMEYVGPHYQQASGTELPFETGSFDVVISCDTLEHIPSASRNDFLAELRRVAGRALIVIAPHALPGVRQAEHVLAEVLTVIKQTNQMLDEHFQYGLPVPELVDTYLREQQIEYVAFESGYLPRWQMMMLLKHQLMSLSNSQQTHIRLDQTYNQRFYHHDQRTPGYRRAYVIAAADYQLPAALVAFVERAASPNPNDMLTDLLEVALMPLVRSNTQLQATYANLEQLYLDLVSHYQGMADQYQNLMENYQTLSGNYHELSGHYHSLAASFQDQAGLQAAHTQAGVLEGEKRGLQHQLELLRWQNELLQQQLTSPSHRLIGFVRNVVRRIRGQKL